MSETLYRIGDLAARYEVSNGTIRNWSKAGFLEASANQSGHRYFTQAAVDAFEIKYPNLPAETKANRRTNHRAVEKKTSSLERIAEAVEEMVRLMRNERGSLAEDFVEVSEQLH